MIDADRRAVSAPVDSTEPASLEGTCASSMGLVVAPTTGRFQPTAIGERIRAGDLLGHITGGRGRADEVRSPVDALLKNLLVRPRQLVRRGQALAWLDVSPA